MILPEALRIGFNDYTVDYVDDAIQMTEDRQAVGTISFNNQRITIATQCDGKPLSKCAIAKTIMHEVLHAIDDGTERNVFADKEDALDAFSAYLCMVLRDNPDFVKLFREKKDKR